MQDWNVVVTVREGGFKEALMQLEALGAVSRSDFYNVLLMRVDDGVAALAAVQRTLAAQPEPLRPIARVMPVARTFVFQTPAEFEAQAQQAVVPWIEQLADRTFHVRMHRRGFHGRLSSQNEERMLDQFIIDESRRRGHEARVNFDDPDLILAVETVGQRAGLSLWTRDERRQYPLLKLD